MGRTYPTFDREKYLCVKGDLKGPIAMFERQEIEADIIRKQKSLASLALVPIGGWELKTAVENMFLSMKKSRPKGREEMLRTMKHWCERFRSAEQKLRQYGADTAGGELDMAFVQILQLYAGFNVEEFKVDFAEAYGLDPDTGTVQARTSELHRELGTLMRDAKRGFSLTKMAKFFRREKMPTRWNGTACREGHEVEYAERILRNFLDDYKIRAPLFDTPVTISGVAIFRLHYLQRPPWEYLYKMMKLAELPKRVLYEALEPEPTAKQSEPAPDGVPEPFRGGKKKSKTKAASTAEA